MMKRRPPVETERARPANSRRSRASEAGAIALLTTLVVGSLSAMLLAAGAAIVLGAVTGVLVALILLATADKR